MAAYSVNRLKSTIIVIGVDSVACVLYLNKAFTKNDDEMYYSSNPSLSLTLI